MTPAVEADGDMIRVRYTIEDELTGPVELTLTLSPSDARTVAYRWKGSIARLYLGHEYGPLIQQALLNTLADLE